ncbi:MAG: DNA translocase FtsK [Dehalococcoidia bacterium]
MVTSITGIMLAGGIIWGYFNQDTVLNFVTTKTELVLIWFGLGIVLSTVSVGILVTLFYSSLMRIYIRHNKKNLISFIGLFIGVWGLFSFYTPSEGFPGWTSASYGNPIGGKISSAITGQGIVQGIIRVSSILFASLIIYRPKTVIEIIEILKFGIVSLYLGLFATSRALSRFYVKSESPKILPSPIQSDEPNIPPEILTPHIRESEIIGSLEGMDVELEVLEGETSPSDKDDSWSESAERLGYFIPETKSSGIPIPKPNYSKTAGEIEGVFNPKEKNLLERDGTKFNKFWSNTDVIYSESETINTTPYNIPNEQDIPEKYSEVSKTDSAPLSKRWILPSLELLTDSDEGGISRDDIKKTSDIIKTTFAEYRIEVEVEKVRPGPTVTMYGIEPGWVRKYKRVRVKDEKGNPKLDKNGKQIIAQEEDKTRISVDNILRREKDLSLALKTPSLRIETPVMGESLLGIEVPNPNPSIVSLKRVMGSKTYGTIKAKSPLPVALGRGSDGDEVVFDLARMPHLLIAGATGSGKSVCMNAIISCLIMERTPSELQMLLVDPKRVELTPYNGIPHLITPVVVETDRVVNLLKGLIKEMMDRYRTMEEIGVRNIETYNKKTPTSKMPYLVVAIDELADLMMTAAFDVEQSICRLAQLGRATGIHLIIATQRPSVDVITGLIKANFPSRISFGVTSQVDSRTILDTTGAERLLGRGDMLYQPIDGTRPVRVQSVYISDDEIGKIVNHWKDTPWSTKPQVDLHTVSDSESEESDSSQYGSANSVGRDNLTDRAIELAQRHSKLSTSLLQRRLRIGYPRAARLMDELEDMGIVGPSDGSKSRDVMINTG